MRAAAPGAPGSPRPRLAAVALRAQRVSLAAAALRGPRALLALAALAAALLLLPASAEAHPLGNFTVNHLSRVSVSADRVEVAYTLDQAEIPTFQERGKAPQAVLAAKVAEVQRGLRLTVDGRPAPLAVEPGARITFPAGQGGLKTTRVEVRLAAAKRGARRVELRDDTFPGRVGWKAVIAAPGAGTDVRSTVPVSDPTNGLRRYPSDLLGSPLDQRTATLTATPGSGRVTAPDGVRGGSSTEDRSGDGLAGIFEDAASGRGVLLLLLLAAFGWGALHALSPGHGKSMVAAYLVGTRGTARHAAALGATVTIAHTAGVFALGVITLALSQYVVPEDLYPWLTLASGLLVMGVGIGVLRSRLRASKHHHEHHEHGHGHGHEGHTHEVSTRSLIAMGASAGMIPCPSALVVLLAALSQHEVGLGLLLITAFSLGLAATITGIGLAVVSARAFLQRFDLSKSRTATALPAVSALAIVVVGCVLTAQAVPGLVS